MFKGMTVVAGAALIALATPVLPIAPAAAVPPPIVVNSTADTTTDTGECTLREAITAAIARMGNSGARQPMPCRGVSSALRWFRCRLTSGPAQPQHDQFSHHLRGACRPKATPEQWQTELT